MPPSVARRSGTGVHCGGTAHGSSIESSPRGMTSVGGAMARNDTRHTPCNGSPGTMVDQELNELRREFLAESAAKVREMEASMNGGRSAETVERLVYLAHQLKGSGGSYGFERITTAAAEPEHASQRLGRGDGVMENVRRHIGD